MQEMTLMQAIAARRAVRAYRDAVVDEATIHSLLEAAVRAPTAMHAEPWLFAVVQDRKLLAQLSDRAKTLAAESPDEHARTLAAALPNIFYDAGTLIVVGSRRSDALAVADCWLASENLMLAACAMGLGTCVIGFAVAALQEAAVKADLGLPADLLPIAPIIVGFPRETPPATTRRAPEIVAWRR